MTSFQRPYNVVQMPCRRRGRVLKFMCIFFPGSICHLDNINSSLKRNNDTKSTKQQETTIPESMTRERTNLLREAAEKRTVSKMSVKCRAICRISCCRLKPETNLALMLCLVFYLYICLGGALFLLLEGQAEAPTNPDVPRDRLKKLMVKQIHKTFNLIRECL